jgi:transcriptional regulator GlxA family with amidase domain
LHVSLLALPDAVISTLSGLFDVMNGATLMASSGQSRPPFHVQTVGEQTGSLMLASGLPIEVQRAIDDFDRTDIVIVPSVLLKSHQGWKTGRYPRLVAWLEAHARARRGPVLGVLGHLPARRDGPVRRQGRHRALRLRAHVLLALSGRRRSIPSACW